MNSKAEKYVPDPELLARMPAVSGNTVNGLGETRQLAPRPFFWHPPERQTHGELQQYIVANFRPPAGEDHSFRNPAVDRGPPAVDIADVPVSRSAENWSAELKAFALANEADLVGITPLRQDYVFAGYSIAEPHLIVVGVAHDFDRLSQSPASDGNLAAYHDLHDQYNRAARVVHRLANHIRENGYAARAFPGPMADALNLIPPAIAAGLGELGKHGSMINRRFGSGFRLSAVATDIPLTFDCPDPIEVDEVCANCRVCTKACPPGAIADSKQLVRGVEKWYVDFDKCIPYFGEHYACGICIAVCPWTLPGVADRLLLKLARRRERRAPAGAGREPA